MKIHPLTLILGFPIILILLLFGMPIVLAFLFQKQIDSFLVKRKIQNFELGIMLIGSELMWLFFLCMLFN